MGVECGILVYKKQKNGETRKPNASLKAWKFYDFMAYLIRILGAQVAKKNFGSQITLRFHV